VASSPGRSEGTTHFRPDEFACPHCGVHLIRPVLLFRLELLRKAIGKPLPIVSGYRCPEHNRAVGGAPDSQHMYGSAVDIPLGLVTVNQAAQAGFIGIGTQHGTVRHLDIRDGTVARWSY
jgi:uncharacterized protein YcbK (DUF882 family)